MAVVKIKRVGIVGFGTMGPRIASACIVHGQETYVYDKAPQALEKGVKWVQDRIGQEVAGGRLSGEEAEASLARLHPAASLQACLARVDLVVENVPEDLEIKRQVWAEIDRLAPAEALICTNSSSLPVSKIYDATSRPEKCFNVNFNIDPLKYKPVEIMRGAKTSAETLVAGEQWVKSIGEVPIVCFKEIMGFAFNRTWRAIKREVLHLYANGHTTPEDLDRCWMLEFEMPFGPFGLMDMIGLDVVRDIERQYYLESRDERDKPPEFLEEMIARGELGVKTGRGFYTYPDPAYQDPDWLEMKGRHQRDLAKMLGLKE